jgi:hypothetical protein
MKRIFVCSRLAPDAKYTFKENLDFVRLCCKVVVKFGHAPYAPHLLCTQFLDDTKAEERDMGIQIGHLYLKGCHELWTFRRNTEEINSTGMRQDIGMAIEHGLPIKNLILHPLSDDGVRVEIIDIGEVWKRVSKEITV